MNRDPRTIVITVVCLTAAAASFWASYRQTQVVDEGEGKLLAQVSDSDTGVRRKPARLFAWHRVRKLQKLFAKDSVKTGERERATIRFENGTRVELGENSLLVIENAEDPSLNFLRGTVVVRDSKGDRQITDEGDGKKKVQTLADRWIKPEVSATSYAVDGAPASVLFQWEQSGGDPSVPQAGILEISSNRSFSGKLVVAREVPSRATTAELGLQPGRYFYRLRAKDGGALTEARTLSVVPARPLEPSGTGETDRFVFLGDKSAVTLTWNTDGAGQSDSDKIEIARDPGFASVPTSQGVSADTGVARIEGLPEGNYYWRLSSRFGEKSVASAPRRLEIKRISRIALNPVFPDPEGEGSSSVLGKPVRFAWKAEPDDGGALQYELEVDSTSGANALRQKAIRASSFEWKPTQPGRYRWRVKTSLAGVSSVETQWKEFDVFSVSAVNLKKPATGSVFRYWEKPPGIDFAWSGGGESGAQYELQVATDPSFSKIVHEDRVGRPEASIDAGKLGGGEYYWRIRTIGRGGSEVSVSQASHFTSAVYDTLAAPEISALPEGKTFDISREPGPVTVQWAPVEGAKKYEVTVRRRTGGRSPAGTLSKQIDGTSFELPASAVEGNYDVTVRAIDPINRPGTPSPSRGFSISYGPALRAPKLRAISVK